MKRSWKVGAVAGSAVLLATGLGYAQAADPPGQGTTQKRTTQKTTQKAQKAQAVDWKPCKDDATAECGTLAVPVDWAKPDGETIDLALARRKATDPSARKGILVVNPGGPGGSGVDFALRAKAFFSPDIQKSFDIVGFDPRGIARSHPIVCSKEVVEQPGFTAKPASAAEFDGLKAYNEKLAADCRKHTGPIIDHVDSVSVAHDIDAIRKALGEKRINYLGRSYGTLIGQMYAEQYPGRIRALAMDSSMDHSIGVERFFRDESATVEDSYREFAKWCGRSEKCALHGQDTDAILDELRAKAEQGELVDPSDGHTVTEYELIGTTEGAFFRPQWVELAQWWKALRDGQAAGTDARAAKKALADPTPLRQPRGELVTWPVPVFCQDWDAATTYDGFSTMWKRAARANPHMRGTYNAADFIAGCQGWPSKVNNPQHRLRYKGEPTLFVGNNLHDPATSYAWALGTTWQLGRKGALLTGEGWGHGVYTRSACTMAAYDAYLLDLEIPAKGASCDAVEPATRAVTPDVRLPW